MGYLRECKEAEAVTAGKLVTRYIPACVLILLFPLRASACECADKLSPEIEGFIFQTWKTATAEKLSQQEREERYDTLVKRLISVAHEARVPGKPLEQLARKCIEFEEANRKMPPGWNYTDKVANLQYFADLARSIVPIHLEMMGYCHKFCSER